MRIIGIAACGLGHEIGKDNELPWGKSLPRDLKRFREATMGKPCVIGRKTWLSICRPLPGRHLIVLSTTLTLDQLAEQCNRHPAPTSSLPTSVTVAPSIEDALARAGSYGADEVLVAGGEYVYKRFADSQLLDGWLLTQVLATFPGSDAHLRSLDWRRFDVTACELHPADEKNAHAVAFLRLDKR